MSGTEFIVGIQLTVPGKQGLTRLLYIRNNTAFERGFELC